MYALLIIQFAHLPSCVQFQYFQYAHTDLILISYLFPCRKDNKLKRKNSRTKTECKLYEYFQLVQYVDECTDGQKQLLHDRLTLTLWQWN